MVGKLTALVILLVIVAWAFGLWFDTKFPPALPTYEVWTYEGLWWVAEKHPHEIRRVTSLFNSEAEAKAALQVLCLERIFRRTW